MTPKATTFPNDSMALRPPSFRLLLSLIGATLVLWGARATDLHIPIAGDVNLLELNRTAALTLIFAAVAAMVFLWVPKRWAAWLSFAVALGAVVFLCHDLYDMICQAETLRQNSAALHNVMDKVLKNAEIKPGAVGVGAGIVLLGVALGLRAPAKVSASV